jgi:fibronectin-binding autotransporter adhesin
MSQAGIVDVISSTPTIPILFVANTGSATPAANTLNVLGTGIITTTGAGDTITIAATSGATESLTGNTGGAVPPTANNINVVGDGTTITVAGNPGTSTLTISAIGTGVVETLTGNSGGAISPSAGNINTVGTGSITVVGSGHTLTTQLTGLTNHSLLIGAGTATITNLGVASNGQLPIGSGGADPVLATLTAGTGIAIANGAGSITISSSGTTNITVTPLTHAASPYTVLSTDDFLAITGSVGTFTVKLPNAPATGKVYIIKDSNGVAATDNIAVTTVGGAVTIDGQTTYTMATNYQSIQVVFDGTGYEVF